MKNERRLKRMSSWLGSKARHFDHIDDALNWRRKRSASAPSGSPSRSPTTLSVLAFTHAFLHGIVEFICNATRTLTRALTPSHFVTPFP